MPKMIKIGEIRVLNYFDLPWNEPVGKALLFSIIRTMNVLSPNQLPRGIIWSAVPLPRFI